MRQEEQHVKRPIEGVLPTHQWVQGTLEVEIRRDYCPHSEASESRTEQSLERRAESQQIVFTEEYVGRRGEGRLLQGCIVHCTVRRLSWKNQPSAPTQPAGSNSTACSVLCFSWGTRLPRGFEK